MTSFNKFFTLTSVILVILLSPNICSATTMVMCIDGYQDLLQSDATTPQSIKNHLKGKSCNHVVAWSWGLSQSGSTQGAGSLGRVNIQDIAITKHADIWSSLLFIDIANQVSNRNATLYIFGSAPEGKLSVSISISSTLVSSLSTGGSQGEDRLTENVTFNFARVEYYVYDVHGIPHKGCYNAASNSSC